MSVDHPAGTSASSLDRPASEPIRYNEILILLGIMLVAGWLRFTGIEWGKNLYLHPDERFQTMVVVATHWPKSIGAYFDSAQSPLNPYNNGFGSYIYGTFPLFAAKLIGTITGNQVYGDAPCPVAPSQLSATSSPSCSSTSPAAASSAFGPACWAQPWPA